MVLNPIMRMERRASSRSAAIKTLLRNPRILNFNLLTVWITSGGKKGEEGEKKIENSLRSLFLAHPEGYMKQRPDQYKMKILVFSIQYDFQILKYQYQYSI